MENYGSWDKLNVGKKILISDDINGENTLSCQFLHFEVCKLHNALFLFSAIKPFCGYSQIESHLKFIYFLHWHLFYSKVNYRKPTFEASLQNLSNDFAKLRSPRFADVIFVMPDGKELSANKSILSVRSPVFEAMFARQEMAENQNNRVVIEDIDADVFLALLDYIYNGEVDGIEQFAPELFIAANKVYNCVVDKNCKTQFLFQTNPNILFLVRL